MPQSFFGWIEFLLRQYGGLFLSGAATTLRIASSFLMGIPVDTIDDMVKSSLDEFSIRVCEKARIQLINKGYLANVNYRISYDKPVSLTSRPPFLSIPFQTQHGQIDVFINLTKNH